MKIIGLFAPALISVWIKYLRDEKKICQMPMILIEYGIYVLVNVLVTTGIITYGLNMDGITADAFDSFPFFTKYVVIAIVAAFLTPYIEEMIKKYIQVTFSVRAHDEKKNIKNNQ